MTKIEKIISVPTGHIGTIVGERGKLLEFVSIGDYGKEKNIKADFLGLTKEINGVPNGDIMPLEEKLVVTISTQYGCSMNCKFCDAPKVGHGLNATKNDLINQLKTGIKVSGISYTKRLNVHFARMGEPTFNFNILDICKNGLKDIVRDCGLKTDIIHPVISTMMPKKNKKLVYFLQLWCNEFKNKIFRGDAGLQLSINDTGASRNSLFNNNSLEISEISEICKYLPSPIGRKYTLNFALGDDFLVEPEYILQYFDPNRFIIKITPIHATKTCEENGIKTSEGYNYFKPYKRLEEEFKSLGFDVIVFVPSVEEDESRITCGNVIISDD